MGYPVDPNDLQYEANKWSQATFGSERGSDGPLNHLKKEIVELSEAIASGDREAALEEGGDCYLLLLDAFSRSKLDISISDVMYAAARKLEVNKQREWPPLNEQGVLGAQAVIRKKEEQVKCRRSFRFSNAIGTATGAGFSTR